ncbi:MAG: class I SAM-dependent methyltransferase [Gemmatimonadaceae bacterium]
MTTSAATENVRRLMGFDTAGEPFVSGDRVYRGIYRGNADWVRHVLRIVQDNDLFSHGIVGTREASPNPHPELDYELVLEHDRIPFVTFPHEWSPSMFKESALLHVALFERLGEHGLTLKDWHPQNILFTGTRPVFVDFTSIIPVSELARQSYLQTGRAPAIISNWWDTTAKGFFEMHRLMYEPYFGLPLALMDQGRHALARKRIYETTLNAADSVITRGEAFQGRLVQRLAHELRERLQWLALMESGPQKKKFLRRIRHGIAALDAAHPGSAYSTYYEDKNEVFSTVPSPGWTSKQRGVHGALVQHKPSTVLDLGSNTGWFSMLAAGLGSSVVAVDLDEGSIDRLFIEARRDGLEILPLVANLTKPLPALEPRVYPNEPSLSLIGDGQPLVSSPRDRLQCEMVLALAIVHHLTLGQGLTFAEVATILAGLSTKYLCVEFVGMDDAMVVGDPAFFPAHHAAPDAFGWYDAEGFVAALREHFSNIEVVPSFPDTRQLLICTK